MLSLKNISVKAENKEILHDISLDFDNGKIYAIMGKNGSGKSTLARTIMGDPRMIITHGSIMLDELSINDHTAYDRAKKGIFLSPQSPLAIHGVTVQQLLRTALPRDTHPSKKLLEIIAHTAQELEISKDLLSRSLNENFSGGERKKMEVLQAAILDPRYIILDEIDTGVDIDSLKTITQFLNTIINNAPQKTIIFITHYNRILSQLPVDEVIIMRDGTITQKGDATLAQKIEFDGYK